jgi:hypothetical protein
MRTPRWQMNRHRSPNSIVGVLAYHTHTLCHPAASCYCSLTVLVQSNPWQSL